MSESVTPPEKRIKKTPSTFLGRPVNKLDIDELEIDEEVVKAARGNSLLQKGGGGRASNSLAKLTALNLAIPKAQKSLRSEDQTVRDEHGRRRFHGAFTGGFSAGYFNTVGTAEGWTPGAFKSSRVSKKQTRESVVEDFMDEEDLEIMTSCGSRKHLTVVPSKYFQQQKDNLANDEFFQLFDTQRRKPFPVTTKHNNSYNYFSYSYNDSADPSTVDYDEPFLSIQLRQEDSKQHSGFYILKELGWREGKPVVFGPTVRRCPRNLGQRVIGPQVYPRGMMVESSESEERVQQQEEILKHASWIIQSISALKKNLWGLGYQSVSLGGLVESSSVSEEGDEGFREPVCNLADNTSFRNEGFQYNKRTVTRSAPKTIRGEAFGVGVFDDEDGDDWDKIYDDDNEQVVLPFDGKKRLPADAALAEAAPAGDYFGDSSQTCVFEVGPEFVTQNYLDPRFAASVPPQAWDGKHHMTPAEEIAENSLRQQEEKGKNPFSELIEFLQQHRAPVTPIKPNVSSQPPEVSSPPSESVKETAFRLQPTPNVEADTQHRRQPLWNRIDNQTKEALLSSLKGFSGFVTPLSNQESSVSKPGSTPNCYFPGDIEQQKRYELFCLALEEKIPASLVFDSSKSSSASTFQEERKLFGDYYRAFRAAHPNLDLYSCCSTVTQNIIASNSQKQKTLEQNRNRFAYNFKPEPRVCRCFGVPDPWDKKEFVDDFPSSLHNMNTTRANNLRGTLSKSRSNTFISEVISRLRSREEVSSLDKEKKEKTVIEEEPASKADLRDDDTWIAPRPPKSMFEAVFGMDEES